jgi:UDP-N-acetylmuramoyl-tripeptide--D-alanyl-D-alanine ligase
MKLEKIYQRYLENPVISTDTRKNIENTFFVAIAGDNFDANKFAEQAKEKDAKYVLTSRKDLTGHEGFIVVEDTLKTLQDLAKFHRQQFDIPIIAITGSNGKTTTKELVSTVLSKKYNCFATPGNLNNHIGLPLSLLRLNKEHEIAVIEIGANHIGENEELTNICLPTHGITTNIGKDHLGEFGDMQGVVKAYKEFTDYFINTEDAFFLNIDDEFLPAIFESESSISFSTQDKNADYLGKAIEGKFLLEATIESKNRETNIQTNLFGDFNLYNVLSTFAIGDYFQVEHKSIQEAIAEYKPENNRSQVIENNSNTYIFDAYNANPSSMKLALESFDKTAYQNKVVVLGDMFELGEFTDQEHTDIINLIEKLDFEKVIFIGKYFDRNNNKIQALVFENSMKLRDWFVNNKFQNSAFLIKGSRGVALEKAFEFFG